ncbi:MAG: TetR/AcrR family transcriptional regulator [Solirubrobacteraceae bacterium]|nr:TetR/AcrR family transcriptional regulator [Solirubrobacteraceae bacterium]
MPRIRAESVAEHVAQQQAAVFEAAMRLFLERGYADVSLADIAAEVGLARNSLYRYFPDKAHILVEWLRRELPIQAARSRERLTGDGPPPERIKRWALDQLDYARRPEHGLIAALSDVARDLDEETRAELADSHRRLLIPLTEALAGVGIEDDRDRSAVSALIGGLIVSGAEHESRIGGDDPVLRAHLLRAVEALLGPERPGGRFARGDMAARLLEGRTDEPR